MSTDAKRIETGLATIHARMAQAVQDAGRAPQCVELVAISKFHQCEAIRLALQAGQTTFGESYVQEALAKQNELQVDTLNTQVQWHFVGHIQSRKAKDVVGRFSLLHSVDSIKLAQLLNVAAAQKKIQQDILIQVNVGEESQKSGISRQELARLAEHIMQCENLKLQGLMCLPPVFDAGLAARPHFALLRRLKEELELSFGRTLPHLSMGMSGDLEAAILEGATLVRVGTDIFGSRA